MGLDGFITYLFACSSKTKKIQKTRRVEKNGGFLWYARLDSNQWPSESESDTLSN